MQILVSQVVSVHEVSQQNFLFISCFSVHALCHTHLNFLDLITVTIFSEAYKLWQSTTVTKQNSAQFKFGECLLPFCSVFYLKN